MLRLLAFLILSLVAPAGAAQAATPATGSVSAAAPNAKWTGTVAGDSTTAAHLRALATAGGTRGQCRAPICDTFTLDVAAGGTKLTVKVSGETKDDYTAVEVQTPDGTVTFVYQSGQHATVVIPNPKAGSYVVRALGSPAAPNATMDYAGVATLEAPPPPPPPAPTRGAPEPAPASPDPQPMEVEGEKPPPPPPTLAAEPDRRRLLRAVNKGFRVRTVCTGGCSKLKVRLFISPLLARQLRLGDGRSEVEVGSAAMARGAEGRRVHHVRFKPRARRALARKRRVDLAIETVAFDPNGGVRSFIRRMTLRR